MDDSPLQIKYDFDNALLKYHTTHDYFMKKLIKNKGCQEGVALYESTDSNSVNLN